MLISKGNSSKEKFNEIRPTRAMFKSRLNFFVILVESKSGENKVEIWQCGMSIGKSALSKRNAAFFGRFLSNIENGIEVPGLRISPASDAHAPSTVSSGPLSICWKWFWSWRALISVEGEKRPNLKSNEVVDLTILIFTWREMLIKLIFPPHLEAIVRRWLIYVDMIYDEPCMN